VSQGCEEAWEDLMPCLGTSDLCWSDVARTRMWLVWNHNNISWVLDAQSHWVSEIHQFVVLLSGVGMWKTQCTE